MNAIKYFYQNNSSRQAGGREDLQTEVKTDRIKVVRLISRLSVGGPAIHAALLTERLDPKRFEQILVAGVGTEQEGDMLALTNNSRVKPIFLNGLGREISPRHDFKAVREVVALLRHHKPHIVHTHTAKAGFVGRMAARLARVPIVIHTFHGNVFQGYFSPAKTRLFISIEKRLASYSDRIVVLSEQQKEEIAGLGIGRDEQFRIVPLGLNLEPFLQASTLRGQLRAELGIAPDVPLVGIVARLVPIKAIDLFLQAVKPVLAQHPRAVFLVVGDGELRVALEEQTRKLGIMDSVRFLGFRSDLPRIYADLDCVTLCSLNEGTPVAIIEALASARPVVATDVGSVRELVRHGHSGTLVPAGNPEQLAQGIIATLHNPARSDSHGLAGRQQVYPAWDAGRLVGDIETLYLDALRQKSYI